MNELWWRARFFFNISPWSIGHFINRDRIPTERIGVGYGGPKRVFLMRCDRCGRRRIAGEWVEMHPGQLGDGWWHECLRCALASMTAVVEARMG